MITIIEEYTLEHARDLNEFLPVINYSTTEPSWHDYCGAM